MAKDFADISRLELAQDRNEAKRDAVSKMVKAWESKNAKRALQGAGLSTMAVTLAACGGSSTTTTTTAPTTPVVTPVSSSLTIGADAVTGTSANDTISGARVDVLQTWNSADSINGAGGVDSLSAVITSSVQPGAGAVTGVENLTVTNANAAGGAATTVTFSSATETFISGVTSITNIGSAADMTFARVTESATVNVNNASGATVVQFADAVLAGTADVVTLNVTGATAAVTIGTSTDADGDYETLIVNSTGAASDMVAGGGLGGDAATVTVTGNAAMDFGTAAAFANVATFNASASTGGVTAVFAADAVAGTTNTKAITGSSGNDTLDISAIAAAAVGAVTVDAGAGDDSVDMGATGAVDFSVAGGAGADTLTVSVVAAAATHGGVSGFETLVSEVAFANSATTTMDLALFTGNSSFTRVDVEGTMVDGATNTTATDIFDITNAGAGIATLGLGALDVTDAQVNFTRQVDGTANALTIRATQAGGSAARVLNANNEETVTFNSATGAHDHTAVSLTAMTTLVAIGDNDVDLGTVTATNLATVDLSALQTTIDTTGSTSDEGDFIANLSSSTVAMTVTSNSSTTHTGIINITTGSGADNVTGTANNDEITTGGNTDTINGGAGNDLITGGAGVDTITGGAGNDTFVISVGANGATAATNLWDIITDFTAQTAAGAAVDVVRVDVGATQTEQLIETAVQLTATSGVVNGEFIVYTGGNVIDVSGNNAADLAAINAALFGASAIDGDNDAFVIFSADTNGDGVGDAVQLWTVGVDGATDSPADWAYQIATFSNISATADLAGVFVVGNFEVV